MIDTPTAVLFGPGKNGFTEGPPATELSPAWCNNTQEEIPVKIKHHQLVDLTLTEYGQDTLRKYIDPEAPADSLATVTLPLWEAFKIFGPAVVGSVRMPFVSVVFRRTETPGERGVSVAVQRADKFESVIRKIGRKMGIAGDFCAGLEAWARANPRMVPDGPGQWWHGGTVVKVVRSKDGHLEYKLGNGRRRAVTVAEDWRGRAMVDPRIERYIEKADDEDIPF